MSLSPSDENSDIIVCSYTLITYVISHWRHFGHNLLSDKPKGSVIVVRTQDGDLTQLRPVPDCII